MKSAAKYARRVPTLTKKVGDEGIGDTRDIDASEVIWMVTVAISA